jgi:carboxyl-terminal processing protease
MPKLRRLGADANRSQDDLMLPTQPPAGRIRRLPWFIVLVAILGGSGLFLSGFALGAQRSATPGTPASAQEAFQPFWDTFNSIENDYALDPVSRQTLVEGAIKGMIDSLGDPFSQYLSPNAFQTTLEGLAGTFSGIGAVIPATSTTDNSACTTLGPTCTLVVSSVIQGAPADKAGVLAGDRIVSINGTALAGSVDDAVAKIRGPKGSTVVLGVDRGSSTSPISISIVRDIVVQKEVETRSLAGGTVGYIRLVGFSDNSARDFASAVKADVDAGQTRLVVDLRGDGGGYVTAAQAVASQFLGDGVIFYEQGADGVESSTNATPGGAATDPRIKVVVLMDGNTASASEIVAGALQARGRAQLIGSQSYGKGTIQAFQQLSANSGGFRLTIAKWLTPNKVWIHHVGLTPDIPITAPANAPAGSDPVLDRALQALAG